MKHVDDQLQIHVLNGGEGDTIIVRLPQGSWGLVDCFARRPDVAHPAVEFLQSVGVNELEFVCLTHPHDDHYRGMSQVLERYPTKEFWHPAVTNGSRLNLAKMLAWRAKTTRELVRADPRNGPVQRRLKSEAKEAEQALEDELASDEYLRILRKTLSGEGRSGPYPRPVTADQYLYPNGRDPSLPSTAKIAKIWSVAPPGKDIIDYEKAIGACFDYDGRLCCDGVEVRHNQASIALAIDYGPARVILGGDVESSSWRQVLLRGSVALSSDAVKVSHHGSTNGYCSKLWGEFAKRSKPVAVITPSARHRLPTGAAVSHFAKFSSQILTTFPPGMPSVAKVATPASAARMRALKRRFLSAQLCKEPGQVGRCSVAISFDGVVKPNVANGAGVITPRRSRSRRAK